MVSDPVAFKYSICDTLFLSPMVRLADSKIQKIVFSDSKSVEE